MLYACWLLPAVVHSDSLPCPKTQNAQLAIQWISRLYKQTCTSTSSTVWNSTNLKQPNLKLYFSSLAPPLSRVLSPACNLCPSSVNQSSHIRPALLSHFSQLSISRHPQATRPTQLLTHLRGAQSQFTNHQLWWR